MTIKKVLGELGLTPNEVDIYLALLQAGTASAHEIAQKTGLHRQAVYDGLNRLLEKSLASFIAVDGAKQYRSLSPERMIGFIHEKEEQFKSILPELKALQGMPKGQTAVEVFKGKGALKTIFRDIIHELESNRGEVVTSGVDERRGFDEEKVAILQYHQRLRELGCTERILIKEGDMQVLKGKQAVYRWIPEENFRSTAIHVYDHKIAIIIYGNPNHAIFIDSESLAESYKREFELLWKGAKPLPPELHQRQQQNPKMDENPFA
jgi:sugar-specific transcriptional regulator TrmB